MRPKPSRWCWGLAVILGVAATATDAAAKSTHESPYTYQQTYGSALRLVKVDLGLEVTEQDAEWGYLLFEYTSRQSGKRKSQGSFEFVRSDEGIRVSLQIPAMPSHHERVIMDQLKRKLTAEHGTPPRPKPAKKPPDEKKPDEGNKGKSKSRTADRGKTKGDGGPDDKG